MKDRDQIITVANKLFMEHGVKSVSIGRIVETLHTSRRTIYNHFADKVDLLSACLDAYNAKVKSENEAIIEGAPNTIAALARLYQQIVKRSHQVNPNYFNDVYHHYNPELLKSSYKRAGNYPQKQMLVLIERGIREKHFQPDIDKEVVMRTVVYLLELMKDNRKFPITKYNRERLTFGVIVPYLRGLCTQEGIELLEKEEELFRFNY